MSQNLQHRRRLCVLPGPSLLCRSRPSTKSKQTASRSSIARQAIRVRRLFCCYMGFQHRRSCSANSFHGWPIDYRVIAPDLPGFGFTEVPVERKYTYSFDALAADDRSLHASAQNQTLMHSMCSTMARRRDSAWRWLTPNESLQSFHRTGTRTKKGLVMRGGRSGNTGRRQQQRIAK